MRVNQRKVSAMTRLSSLCLLTALAISTCLAAPSTNAVEVSIGEPHEIKVPANAKISGPVDMPLPDWMERDGDTLKMIAPPNAEKTNLVLIGEMSLDIVVKENQPTGCTIDEWAEAVVKGPPMAHWNTIKRLVEMVDDIEMTNVRILPRSYSVNYRQLTEKGEGWDKGEGDTVIVVKTKCDQVANTIIEELYSEGFEDVSISKGSIPSRATRNEDANSILSGWEEMSTDGPIGEEELHLKNISTTTLASTTTTRHARSPSVAYVPIKAMHCKQGAFCVGELEEKTFMGGDGGVGTFDLTIEQMDSKGGVHPWVMKGGKKRSIGVIPLTAGDHTFKLRGVDRNNKPLFSPFSISVQADEPKNHQFKMTMHSLPPEPQFLRTALVKLASYLRRNPDEIKVANVSSMGAHHHVVTYWNTSLPTTSCPTKEVAQWLRGLHHKHTEEVTADFAKAFSHIPTIHPARLEVQWLADCESAAAAAGGAEGGVKTAGGVGGGSKQGEEPIAEETEGSLTTLISVVCILALLFALLILIVCCVACRKSKNHKGSSEFMSKGTPVVFPDEVEDEHTDIPATAPMLVKEERPPIRVSEHSNPLYKPPPPLASTAASPRPSAPSAHKLPPPYVPP